MHKASLALAAALSALAVPATAGAHISIARGKHAIKPKNPFAVISRCHRDGQSVSCHADELITEGQVAGWTLHFTEYAFSHHGKLIVRSSI